MAEKSLSFMEKAKQLLSKTVQKPSSSNSMVFRVGEGLTPEQQAVAKATVQGNTRQNMSVQKPLPKTTMNFGESVLTAVPRALAQSALTISASNKLKSGANVPVEYRAPYGSFLEGVLKTDKEPIVPYNIARPDVNPLQKMTSVADNTRARTAAAIKPATTFGEYSQIGKDLGLGETGQRAAGSAGVLLGVADLIPGAGPLAKKGVTTAAKKLAKESAEKVAKEGAEAVARSGVKAEAKALKGTAKQVEEALTKDWSLAVPPSKMGEVVSDAVEPQIKKSRLAKRVAVGGEFAEDVNKNIDIEYEVLRNKETVDRATKLIKQDENAVKRAIFNTEDELTPDIVVAANMLAKRANAAKNFDEAVDIISVVSERATKQGQAIQALSLWNRLTPEGAIRFAQKVVDKANKPTETLAKKAFRVAKDKMGIQTPADITAEKAIKKYSLSGKDAEEISTLAKAIEKTKEGTRENSIAIGKLMARIGQVVPPSASQKVAMIQTLAQLVNPKTPIRNILGNTAMMALENVADVGAAVLDVPISWVTGERSKGLPQMAAQAAGFKRGATEAIQDIKLGIDTAKSKGQYDITKRVFDKGVLGKLEDALSYSLKVPDRAAFEATRDGVLAELMALKGATKPDAQMLEIAHYEALRRTFQDPNVISKALSGLKKTLNIVGTPEFGLGDFVLKYPKTPGAIIKRGIEFSPLGFFEAAFALAKPIMGDGKRIWAKELFDQRKFVESTSRALVGTSGLIGTGAALYKLGIITGKEDVDKDIAALSRSTGLGDYRMNVSALKRFVMSGMSDPAQAKLREGDTLVSYDWFQPASIPLAMGANIEQNQGKAEGIVGKILAATTGEKDVARGVVDFLGDILEVAAEQPVIQSVRTAVTQRDIKTGVNELLTNIPASFVPTFINQLRQLTDNTSRNTFDPSVLERAFNKVQSKIPLASKLLPEGVTPLGEDRKVLQDGGKNKFMDIVNVLFNPAFVSSFKPSPEAKMVIDIYNNTGETKQAPKVVDKKLKRFGLTIELTGREQTELQRDIGTDAKALLNKMVESEQFMRVPEEKRAEMMSSALSKIYQANEAPIVLKRLGVDVGPNVDKNVQYKILQKAYANKTFKALSQKEQTQKLQNVFNKLGQ